MTTRSGMHRERVAVEFSGATVLLFTGTGPRARSGASVSQHMACAAAEYLGIARPIVIERDTSGRPRLVDAGLRGAALSTSSTTAYRAVAVCTDGEVGVDVEAVRPEYADPVLTACALAAGERLSCAACVNKGVSLEPAAAFTRLWTRKEAALKLLGLGLKLDPRTIVVNCCGPATRDSLRICHLHSMEAVPGVWLTTATCDAAPPEVTRIDSTESQAC